MLNPLPDEQSIITTARLRLVPLLAIHAKEMFSLLSHPSLYVYTGGNPPASEAALSKRYELLATRRSPDEQELWLNWVMLDGQDGPLGFVQATVAATCIEIAWVVGVKWQGKGYASEAAAALVTWLRAQWPVEIRACVHPDHKASQRVASRAGLRLGGEIIDGEEVWVLPTRTYQ